jgi:hypothetical protein
LLSRRFIGEESGSVFEARKSALRLYQTPFTSRLWRPFREIQSSFEAFLSMSASSLADGVHLGGIEIQLFAPDQPRLDTQLDDPLEELSEYRQAEAIADAGERGMMRQSLEEIVAYIPPQ